jgi:hypothetical protein
VEEEVWVLLLLRLLFVFGCISTVVVEGACVRDCRCLRMCLVSTVD